MFLVSMADIIGSYERLPNDAVRAVTVNYYFSKYLFLKILSKNLPKLQIIPRSIFVK